VQHAVFVAPPHRSRDEGTDDLGDAVVGDHVPALDPVEKGDRRGNLRVVITYWMGLKLRSFYEICVISGSGSSPLPPLPGTAPAAMKRLPPRHALSFVFTPITSPSARG